MKNLITYLAQNRKFVALVISVCLVFCISFIEKEHVPAAIIGISTLYAAFAGANAVEKFKKEQK